MFVNEYLLLLLVNIPWKKGSIAYDIFVVLLELKKHPFVYCLTVINVNPFLIGSYLFVWLLNHSFGTILKLLGKPVSVIIRISTLIKMVNGIPVEVLDYLVALRSNNFPLLVIHFFDAAWDWLQFEQPGLFWLRDHYWFFLWDTVFIICVILILNNFHLVFFFVYFKLELE